MEELLIEEKAKRYDEAIKRLEDIKTGKCQKTFVFTEGLFDYIFPELCESDDERIRKSLIGHLKECRNNTRSEVMIGEYAKWIAWLEKQGESDETKAKMFLINKGYPIDANGTFPTCEEMYDIIKEGLEKQGEQKPTIEMKSAEESLGIDSDTYNKIVDECIYGDDEQKPDETEKGTKGNDRGIPISEPPLTIKHAREVTGIKQDDALGEEDVKMIGILIAIFEVNYPDGFYKVNPIGTTNMQGIHSSEIINWLKSLRPQNRWKPSDEQMDALLFVVQHYTPNVTDKLAWDSIKILELMYYEIKTLKL